MVAAEENALATQADAAAPAEMVPRQDQGKPTEKFEVGQEYEVLRGIQTRQSEALDSPQVRVLPNKSRVTVVEIGTGPTGRRVCIRDESGRKGWVSIVAANGDELLKPAAARPPKDALVKVASKQPLARSQEVAGRNEAAPPQPLGDPITLTVSWNARESVVEKLGERLVMEGCLPSATGSLALLDCAGVLVQSWPNVGAESCQDVFPLARWAEKSAFPLTMRFCPLWPGALQCVLEALEPSTAHSKPGQALMDQLYQAANSGDLAYVRRTIQQQVKLASGQGVAKAITGGPQPLASKPPADFHCPIGHRAIEHLGKWYWVRERDGLVFDPSDTEMPKAVWSRQLQKVQPVEGRSADSPHAQITFFHKSYVLLHGSKLFDPDTQHVVARRNRETMQVQRVEPIPIIVADFLERKGFSLQSSSSEERSSFLQILRKGPQEALMDWNEAMEAVTQGSWKMLRFASSELRGDRELVLKAVQDDAADSWKMLVYAAEQLQRDPEVALEAVKQDVHALAHVDPVLLEDRDFMMDAVREQPLALRYASEELQSDQEVVLEAVSRSWHALHYAGPDLLADHDVFREAIGQSWRALQLADDVIRSDKELVLLALEQNWWALQFAADSLRADADIVSAALQQSPDALHFAAPALRADGEFMLAAVRRHGEALRHAADQLRASSSFVLEAVKRRGCALKYADAKLAADRAVVLAAVKQDPRALKYAAMQLHSDPEIALACLSQDRSMFEQMPMELRRDASFMLEAVKLQGSFLKFASATIRLDPDVVMQAVQQDWQALRYAAEELLADRAFMLRAVREHGTCLAFAHDALRADAELVLQAAQNSIDLLEYAAASLTADNSFMMRAVEIDGAALKFASLQLRADRALVMEAVQRNGLALEDAEGMLRADQEVVLTAVKQVPQAFSFAAEELRSESDFVARVVAIDGLALQFAAEEARAEPAVVLAAVRQNWRAVKYAARGLREDTGFMQKAVAINGLVLAFAAGEAAEDPQLLMASSKGAASKIDPRAFQCTDLVLSRPSRRSSASSGGSRVSGLPLPAFSELVPEGGNLRPDELVSVALRQLGVQPAEGRPPSVMDATLDTLPKTGPASRVPQAALTESAASGSSKPLPTSGAKPAQQVRGPSARVAFNARVAF